MRDDKKKIDFDSEQYDICDETDDVQNETRDEKQDDKFKEIVKKISKAS